MRRPTDEERLRPWQTPTDFLLRLLRQVGERERFLHFLRVRGFYGRTEYNFQPQKHQELSPTQCSVSYEPVVIGGSFPPPLELLVHSFSPRISD